MPDQPNLLNPDSDLGPGDWVLAQRRNAQAAALAGLDSDPDEAARAIAVGENSKVPAPVAGIDVEHFEKQQKAALVSSLLEGNQQLRDYALGHPLAAKVSADDWGQLDSISQAIDKFHGSNPFYAPSRIGQSVLGAAASGFKEGMENAGPYGEWIDPKWGLLPLPRAELAALGYPVELTSHIFSGITEAVKRGAAAGYQQFGGSPSNAESFGNEVAGIAEAELTGMSGRHGVEAPTMPQAMAQRATEAFRAAKPYLQDGKVPPVGLHPLLDQIHVEQAKLDAKNLDELYSESQQSATRERAPDLFRDFIRQHTDASIGIDAEAVRKLYGDKVPTPDDGLLGWVPGIQDQLDLAERTGGDVEVPLADWLAKADPEVVKELHDSLRVRPGGVTLEEGKTLELGEGETAGAPEAVEGEEVTPAPEITPVDSIRRAAKLEAPSFAQIETKPAEGGIIPEAAQDAGVKIGNENFGAITFKLGDALKKIDTSQLSPETKALYDFFADRLGKLEGDTGVWVLDTRDMPAINQAVGNGPNVPGFYHGDVDSIILREDVASGAVGHAKAAELLLHEAWHAFTLHALRADPELKSLVSALADEADKIWTEKLPELRKKRNISYGLDNSRGQREDEFLSMAGSNPEFTQLASVTPLSKELAKKIGLHETHSLWDGIRAVVKRLLMRLVGRDIPDSILDGILHLGQRFEEVNARLEKRGGGVAAAPPLEPELPGMTRLEDRPLFEKAAAIGMTKAQMERYQALIAKRNAEDAAHQQKIAERRATEMQTKEWKENYSAVREQAAKDVRARPDIAADLLFRNGELYGEKVSRPKLGSKQLTPEQRATLPKEYLGEGIHPDDAAGLFGYQSGDSLVAGLARLHAEREREGLTPAAHLTKLTDVEAERMMRRDYGSLEQSILDEAKDHVISSTQLDMLHEELLALGTHAKAEMPIKKDEIKGWVKEQFNKLSVGSHSTDKYLAQAGRAGADAEKALLEERPGDAFKAKQQQYTSLLLANEAKRLEKERKTFDRTAKRFSKREVAGLPAEYTNWVHDILMRTGNLVRRSVQDLQDAISRETSKTLEEFTNRVNDNTAIWEKDENSPSDFKQMPIAQFLFDQSYRKPISDMSVEEFRAVNNSVKTLIKNGRDEQSVLVDGDKKDLRTTITAMTDQIKEVLGDAKHVPIPGEKRGFRKTLRTYWASLLQVESIFNRFDRSNPKGIFFKTLTGPLFEASNGLAAMEREFSQLYKQLRFDPKEMKRSVSNSLFIDPLTSEPMVMNRGHLMAVLQNVGNPSQLDKLARGYKVDPKAIMDWVFANTKKEDWDRAQALGDIFEKAFERAADMYHSLSGVAPEKIDIREIETPFGTYKGWYHPIIYDPDRPGSSKKLMGPSALDDGSYYRAAAPQGYTKKRTGYAAPILLSLDSVPAKLRAILNDAAMRPTVSEAAKVFYDPKFQMAITTRYGKEVKDLLIPYLKDVAGQKQYKDAAQSTALRVLEKARQNVIATLIGLNPSTVMKHGPTAAMLSMNEVGYLPFLRELKSLVSFSDELGEKNWNFAMNGGMVNGEHWGGSEELQRRHRNWQETLTGAQADVFGENTLRNSVIKFGATPVALSDLFSAVPTWLAAYKSQIRAGETHGSAVSFADRAVRRAHGSSAVTARPRIMRGGPLAQFATPFYTFFNEMFQRQYEMAWRAKEMLGQFSEGEYREGLKQLPFLSSGLWAYVVFPALVEQIVSPILTGNQPEALKVLGWGARTVGSSFPVLRDVIEAFLSGHDPTVGLYSTLTQSGIDFAKDASRKNLSLDKAHAGKTIKHATTLFGMLTGLTNAQEGKTGEFVYDYATGRQRPRDLGDVVRGLYHGQMKEPKR